MTDTLAFDAVDDSMVASPPMESNVEPEPTPVIELLPAKRGQCRVCGEAAKDGRSFYCNDHLELAPQQTRFKSTPLGAPSKLNPARELVKARRNEVKKIKSLILGANPQIVAVGQWAAQIPDEWMDNREVASIQTGINEDGSPRMVTLFDPTLKEQLSITDKQAEILAEGVVQFSNSPTGRNMVAMAGAIAPYVTLGAAAGVIVLHAIKLQGIKQQVGEIKNARMMQIQQAQEQQMPQQPDIYEQRQDVA